MEAVFYQGQVYWGIGDFGRAAALLGRNVKVTDREAGTHSTDRLISSQAWLARTLSALGAFAEGRALLEEGIRKGIGTGALLNLAYVLPG